MTAKFILPFLSLLAFYTTFYFAEINGTSKLVKDIIAERELPHTLHLIRKQYTGYASVDELLTILVVFFWPITDGSHLPLSIHSISFAGALGSTWILITLEAWRRGNAWKAVAFPMIAGLVAQVLTIAFVAPLYCTLQLFTSVTAARPTPENIRIPRAVLNAIPVVFVIGYLVPTGVLLIPWSEDYPPYLKQASFAYWQPWPAYVSIMLTVVHALFSSFTRNDHNVEGGRATLSSLRWVYAFAFSLASLSHIVSWAIPLAAMVLPDIFGNGAEDALHPFVVFGVPKPWETPSLVQEIGEGVHALLRWDYLIASAGVLIWAVSLYQTAHRVVYGRAGFVGLVFKVAALTVLTGPVGAAVELMWERDELVMNEMGGVRRAVPVGKKVA